MSVDCLLSALRVHWWVYCRMTYSNLLDCWNQCRSEHVMNPSNLFIWFLIYITERLTLSDQLHSCGMSWSDNNVISNFFGSYSFVMGRCHNQVFKLATAPWKERWEGFEAKQQCCKGRHVRMFFIEVTLRTNKKMWLDLGHNPLIFIVTSSTFYIIYLCF